jgi:hypothetical protein
MQLSGKDVWEAIVKLGLMSGPYDPRTNRYCSNADRIAGLLNEVLGKQESDWLPKAIQSEDAMRVWEANTPREHVLRLYKFLNLLGYTVIGIDAAIERERKSNKRADTISDFAKKTRP